MKTLPKYWNVKEVASGNFLFLLNDISIFSKKKLILHFYCWAISPKNDDLLSIPISPILAKFYPTEHEFYRHLNHVESPYHPIQFNKQEVEMDKYVLNYPFGGVIETDFSKGILFRFKKEKDKDKLIHLLEKAYHSMIKGFSK